MVLRGWTHTRSRPFLLAFMRAALIGVILLFVDTHVARAAPTCTINWTGGGGTASWFTAVNWDQNRLPTPTDNVCIPATTPAITVTYDQNQSTQILSLQSQEPLAVSTGELDLTDTTQTSTISGGLTWSGGTLGGSGDVVVGGPMGWSGGTKSGSGTLTANGGMTVSGTDPKSIAGGVVENPAGQTAVIDGTGGIDVVGGGTFSNDGAVDDQVDVGFSSGPGNAFDCGTLNGSFSNSGTFTKSGGAGATVFCPIAFNNSGVVNINSGTLSLLGGQSTGGSFAVAAGSTLNFGPFGGLFANSAQYALDGSSHVTGAGTVSFTRDAVTFASGATYTAGSTTLSDGSVTFNNAAAPHGLTWSGGTLGGSGDVVVGGPMGWSGGTKSGSGTLTANGGMTVSGTDPKSIAGGVVENPAGQTAVIDGTGGIDVVGGGTFSNDGAVDDQVDVGFSSGPGNAFDCGTLNGSFSNSGTFTKSGGAGATVFCPIAFNNSGVVNINSGTLSLLGGQSTGGSFAVAAGSTLNFGPFGGLFANSAQYALDGSSHVTGAGTVSFTRDAVTFASGATYTAGSTTLSDGSVTFNNAAAPHGLTWSGGTLGGSGDVVVGGPMGWSGGTKSGSGTLTANGGMTVSGTDPKSIAGGVVENPAGQTAVIDGTGGIDVVGGGTFSNDGAVDDQVDVGFSSGPGNAFDCGTLNGSFSNSGTFTKSGGAGATVFCPIAFNNSGVVNINSGTLSLLGGQSTGGSFAVAAGSTLNFGPFGGLFANSAQYALDGSSHVTGAGTVSFTRDAVTFASGATYTAGSTTLSDGSVTFNNDVSTGTYTQTGGTLGINLGGSTSCSTFGQVNVGGGATLGGTLSVGVANGCSPTPMQCFQIMNYVSRTGTFGAVSTPTVNGQPMPVSYFSTNVTVGSNCALGRIVVKKVTDPASDTTTQFTFDPSYGSSFKLTGGSSNDSVLLAPGSGYSVSESATSGWDQTSASCDNGNTPDSITVSAGQTVTCTFTNAEQGRATVVKTVTGSIPSGTQSFTFQLRQGASTTAAGSVLETGTATAADGGVIAFATLLMPGRNYQLCEQIAPGWTTTLGPPLYLVFNPSGDTSVECTDFTVVAGATKEFDIDNTPPAALDAVPPVVTGTPDRAANTVGWYNAPVTIHWTSVDPPPSSGPPIQPPDTVAATEGANVTYTSALSCDPAGNCATGSIRLSIDRTPPSITIAGVADGGVYVFGAVPSPSCSASDSLSGVAAPCSGTVSGGDANGLGRFTFTATAKDVAGNVATKTANYQVVNGRRVVFVSIAGGGSHIYVMNSDGSNVHAVTSGRALDTTPAFSPDGSQIAFASSRTGNGDIYVMNADGSGLRRLTTSPAIELDPSWSPDGRRVRLRSPASNSTRPGRLTAAGSCSCRPLAAARTST